MTLVIGTNCGFVTVRPTDNPSCVDETPIANDAQAFKVVAPSGATKVTEIGWWCRTETEAADTEVGIYDHDAVNNAPETLLGSATFAKGTTSGWKYAAVNIDITEGTTYWIAVQLDFTVTNTLVDFVAEIGQKTDFKTGQTELPSSWGTSDISYPFMMAFYAVYTSEPTAFLLFR